MSLETPNNMSVKQNFSEVDQKVLQQRIKETRNREILESLNQPESISALANILTGAASINLTEESKQGASLTESNKNKAASFARRGLGWAQRFVTDRFNIKAPGLLSAKDVTEVWKDILNPKSLLVGEALDGKKLNSTEAIIQTKDRTVLANTTLKNVFSVILDKSNPKSDTYLKGLTQITGAISRFDLENEITKSAADGFENLTESKVLARALEAFQKSFETINSQYKIAETAHNVGKLDTVTDLMQRTQVKGAEGTGLTNTAGETRSNYNLVYHDKEGKLRFSPRGLLKGVSALFQRAALNPVTAWLGFAPTLVAGATITQDQESSITNLMQKAIKEGKSPDYIKQLFISALEESVTKQESKYKDNFVQGIVSDVLGYSTINSKVGMDAGQYAKALELMEKSFSKTSAVMDLAKAEAQLENSTEIISDADLLKDIENFEKGSRFLSIEGAKSVLSDRERLKQLSGKIALNTATLVIQGRVLNLVGEGAIKAGGVVLETTNVAIENQSGVNVGKEIEKGLYNAKIGDYTVGGDLAVTMRNVFGWTSQENKVNIEVAGKKTEVTVFATHDMRKFANALDSQNIYTNGDISVSVPKGTNLSSSDFAKIAAELSSKAVNTSLVLNKDLGSNQSSFNTENGAKNVLSKVESHVIDGSRGGLLTGQGNSGTAFKDASGNLYLLSATGDDSINGAKWSNTDFKQITDMQQYEVATAPIIEIVKNSRATSVNTESSSENSNSDRESRIQERLAAQNAMLRSRATTVNNERVTTTATRVRESNPDLAESISRRRTSTPVEAISNSRRVTSSDQVTPTRRRVETSRPTTTERSTNRRLNTQSETPRQRPTSVESNQTTNRRVQTSETQRPRSTGVEGSSKTLSQLRAYRERTTTPIQINPAPRFDTPTTLAEQNKQNIPAPKFTAPTVQESTNGINSRKVETSQRVQTQSRIETPKTPTTNIEEFGKPETRTPIIEFGDQLPTQSSNTRHGKLETIKNNVRPQSSAKIGEVVVKTSENNNTTSNVNKPVVVKTESTANVVPTTERGSKLNQNTVINGITYDRDGNVIVPTKETTSINRTTQPNSVVVPTTIRNNPVNEVVVPTTEGRVDNLNQTTIKNGIVYNSKGEVVVQTENPAVAPYTVVPTENRPPVTYDSKAPLTDRLRQFRDVRNQSNQQVISNPDVVSTNAGQDQKINIQNKINVTSSADIAQSIKNGRLDKVADIVGWEKVAKGIESQLGQQREVPQLLHKLANGEQLDQKTLDSKKVSGFSLSQWQSAMSQSPSLRQKIQNSTVTFNTDAIRTGASNKIKADIPSMLIGLATAKINFALESERKFNASVLSSYDIQSTSRTKIDPSAINFELKDAPKTGTARVISENGLPIIYDIQNEGIKRATLKINRDGKEFANVVITNPEVLANLTSGKVKGEAAINEIIQNSNSGVEVQYSSGSRVNVKTKEGLLSVLNGDLESDPNLLKNKSVNTIKFDSSAREIPTIIINGQNLAKVGGENARRLGKLSDINGEIKTDSRLVDPKIRNERAFGLYVQAFQNGDSATQKQLLEGLNAFQTNQEKYGLHKLENSNNPEIQFWAGVSKVANQHPDFVSQLRKGNVSDVTINSAVGSIKAIDNSAVVSEALIARQKSEFEQYRSAILQKPIPKEMQSRFDRLTPQEQAQLVRGVKGDAILDGMSFAGTPKAVANDDSLAKLVGVDAATVVSNSSNNSANVSIYGSGIDQTQANQQFAQINQKAHENAKVTNKLFGVNIGGINGVTAAKVLYAVQNIALPVSFSQGSTSKVGESGVIDFGGSIENQPSNLSTTAIAYVITQDGQIHTKMSDLMKNGADERGYGLSPNEALTKIVNEDVLPKMKIVVENGQTKYRYNINGAIIDTAEPQSAEEIVNMTRNIAVNLDEVGSRVKTATGLTPHTDLKVLVNSNIEAYSSNQVKAKMVAELGNAAAEETDKVIDNLFRSVNQITAKKISNAEFNQIKASPNFKLYTNVQDLGFGPNNKLALVGKFYKDGGDYTAQFGKGFYASPADVLKLKNGEKVRVYFNGCDGNIGFAQLPKVSISGSGETGYSLNSEASNLNIDGKVGSGNIEEEKEFLGIGFKIPKEKAPRQDQPEQPKTPETPKPQPKKVDHLSGDAQSQTAPGSEPGIDVPLKQPVTPIETPDALVPGQTTPSSTGNIIGTPTPSNVPQVTIINGRPTLAVPPSVTPVYQGTPTPFGNGIGNTLNTPSVTPVNTFVPPVNVTPVVPPTPTFDPTKLDFTSGLGGMEKLPPNGF
jgi:hypothetical protein